MKESRPTKLLELPEDKVQEFISLFDTILVDCDGVLWHEDTAIPNAPETVNRLKELGKQVYLVTNNSVKTRREVWQRARNLGFGVDVTDIQAPIHAIGEYLRQEGFAKKAYVIGCDAMTRELATFGIQCLDTGPDVLKGTVNEFIEHEIIPTNTEEVGAVIVGFDEQFSYPKMMRASHYLANSKDCLFILTNADAAIRSPEYHIPGTAAIAKSIETCVGRCPMLFGKPERRICASLLQQGLIKPERTIMIGDCCHMDVAFGKNCGFATMLVGSGNTSPEYFARLLEDPIGNQFYIPDYYLPSLGDLFKFLHSS